MLSLNSNLGDVQMVIGITVRDVHADALFYKKDFIFKKLSKTNSNINIYKQ